MTMKFEKTNRSISQFLEGMQRCLNYLSEENSSDIGEDQLNLGQISNSKLEITDIYLIDAPNLWKVYIWRYIFKEDYSFKYAN